MARDYSSIYAIKDFAMNELAAKYFNFNQVNDLNAGLIGYTTELAAVTTEDSFNAVTMNIQEIFPNRAKIPETLYNFATMHNIDSLMAVPSSAPILLLVKESDVINKGQKDENHINFFIDSNLIVNVEQYRFSLDYDIYIQAIPFGGSYNYRVQYLMDFKNDVSDLKNPYLRFRQITLEGEKHLMFLVNARQVDKFQKEEIMISNDKINLPTITVRYINQLANFEVFYKAPGSDVLVQLDKKLLSSAPVNTPFCFYKFVDEDRIDISFSTRENAFRPEFNSTIIIEYQTTNGKSGDFLEYSGLNSTVLLQSNKYEYNNDIIMNAVLHKGSTGGQDRYTLEDIRETVIERRSTSGAYNTESDLQLYFSRYERANENRVLFLKTRDDMISRIFTAFSLFKDKTGNYYQTNTLYVDLDSDKFDVEYNQSDSLILKAGHVFTFKPDSPDNVYMLPEKISNDLTPLNHEFLYTNPFLMSISKKPTAVGYYLNSFDETKVMDYRFVNPDSTYQFMASSMRISRNALRGEDVYRFSINVTPASIMPEPIMDEEDPTLFLGNLKVLLTIEDDGSEVCYQEFVFEKFDTVSNSYVFNLDLKTDDYMTMAQKMRVIDTFDMETHVQSPSKLIPMLDATFNVVAFFKSSLTDPVSHQYSQIPQVADYTLTNIYSTLDETVSLIRPLNIVRSFMKYVDKGNGEYGYQVAGVPLIEAKSMQKQGQFQHFMDLISTQYNYLMNALDRVTNNYGINMKFYNTYGRSKNFVIGENKARLDKTNIRIKIQVAPTIGAIEEDLIRDLKVFIKEHIENVNSLEDDNVTKGYNAIYVSRLIQAIENEFDAVLYMKFVSINNYDSSVQVVENLGTNIDLLTKEERKDYIPEYLTIRLEDIVIDILRTTQT